MEPPAKVANPAKAGLPAADHDVNFRNFRNFRSRAGLEFQQRAEPDDDLAQRVDAIADAYAERIAIVMEAGDIGEAEARRIAEAEIGRRFVELFLSDGERPGVAATQPNLGARVQDRPT
jgi:hypothetical protein